MIKTRRTTIKDTKNRQGLIRRMQEMQKDGWEQVSSIKQEHQFDRIAYSVVMEKEYTAQEIDIPDNAPFTEWKSGWETDKDELLTQINDLTAQLREVEQQERDDFAYWIRVQRRALKLSQNDLGRKLGTTQSNVYNWERAKTLPVNVQEIAQKLKELRNPVIQSTKG